MSSNPSPAIAAFLSFIFPGAGQVYAGETRKGLIWAIPMFVLVVAVALILLGGQNALFGLVSSTPKRLALLVFNVAFFLYHLAAMLDAYAVARHERSRSFGSSGYTGAAPIVLAALVSLTLIIHGLPEVYGIQAHNAISNIFNPDRPNPIPSGSFGVSSLPPHFPDAQPGRHANPHPHTEQFGRHTGTEWVAGTERVAGSVDASAAADAAAACRYSAMARLGAGWQAEYPRRGHGFAFRNRR